MATTDVIRAAFDAYLSQDAEAMSALLDDEFVFTSPQDDHIDRAAFMERCFPTAGRFRSHEILDLVPAGVEAAFVLYEYELAEGERHRNTEYIRVAGGRLLETQVFFGGRV